MASLLGPVLPTANAKFNLFHCHPLSLTEEESLTQNKLMACELREVIRWVLSSSKIAHDLA